MGLEAVTQNQRSPEPGEVLGVTHWDMIGDGLSLAVAPRHVVRWDDFTKVAPDFSIALDGYVFGRPRFDRSGPYLNLNHHEEVDRLGTRSTCAQVMVNLRQGLPNVFVDEGSPRMNIFVNDPDQDVCVSVWLLRHHREILNTRREAFVNKLVLVEDMLDTTAGAFPFKATEPIVQELTWIFDPYAQARASGALLRADGAEMAAINAAVGERITQYSHRKSERMALDTRYEQLGGGDDWMLIHEIGPGARTALFHSGCLAFVSACELEGGRYKYSIGKMSPLVHFPIEELYGVLNSFEGIPGDAIDRWGGGDIIGGSPRKAGSRLSPNEVERIINRYLKMIAS